jgi:hypothetical protein
MSTDYRLLKKVPACDLFDGRLEGFGVREHVKPDATTEKSRLLTDGRNYLWVYIGDDGFVGCLTRYYPNGAPGKILSVLAEVFDTDIVSEYEPRFWGFDSQEEWDADTEQWARESRDRFYLKIIHIAGRVRVTLHLQQERVDLGDHFVRAGDVVDQVARVLLR